MTNERDEWSEWFEHDGMGCPVNDGIEVYAAGENSWGYIQYKTTQRPSEWLSWDWSNFCKRSPCGGFYVRIIRYQIRKPLGLTILESCLTDLPTPQREGEPA